MSVIALTVVKRRRHSRSSALAEGAVFAPARWMGPRWGVALAAVVVIAVGLGARWVLPDLSQFTAASAMADRSAEVAVADTPFDDEPLPTGARTAGHLLLPAAPVRDARPLPLPGIPFEAKTTAKSKKADGR